MKYSNDELKKIYNQRYLDKNTSENNREIDLYKKYQKLLLNKIDVSQYKGLDLGCGEGSKIVGFSKGFKSTLAIDLSQEGIKTCKRLFSNKSNVQFECKNAMDIEGGFDCISAFGFSLFNQTDNNLLVNQLLFFLNKNLNETGRLVLGSFTDFSGNTDSTWYQHSQNDLGYIVNSLKEKGYTAKVVFPHKKLNNYFSSNLYNFIVELIKLVVKRKRTFFIIIQNEQNKLVK